VCCLLCLIVIVVLVLRSRRREDDDERMPDDAMIIKSDSKNVPTELQPVATGDVTESHSESSSDDTVTMSSDAGLPMPSSDAVVYANATGLLGAYGRISTVERKREITQYGAMETISGESPASDGNYGAIGDEIHYESLL